MRKLLAVLLFAALPALGQGFFRTQSVEIRDFHPSWRVAEIFPDAKVEAIRGEDGFVHLRGMIAGPPGAYAWIVFNLPQGFRPELPEHFLVAADGGQASLLVMPDGRVWIATNSGMWASLSGVTYKVQ